MKELSIEEKAKRYDEAIKRAKECHTDGLSLHQPVKDVLEHIFPELKESEDERIRKEMIEILEKEAHDFPSSVIAEKSNSWIAWLEKQGESYTKRDVDDAYLKGVTNTKNEIEKQYKANYQIRKDIATFIFNYKGDIKDRTKWMDYLGIKVSFVGEKSEQNLQGKSALEAAKEKKVDNANKVEPKFKVGNWVVYQNNTFQVQSLSNETLILQGEKYQTYFIEELCSLWTIEDAKDGDVLVDEDNNIGIYKEIEGICWHSYIYLGCDNRLYGFSIGGSHIQNNTKPATKEQRDILFARMKEAGYEWDAEKKELKKVEQTTTNNQFTPEQASVLDKHTDKFLGQKPAWSEEDERIYKSITYSFAHNYPLTVQQQEFVKSLKDKVLPQPKQEWSEEDEDYINDLIKYFSQNERLENTKEDIVIWLKSLRPQNKWKPSDEQIENLSRAFNGGTYRTSLLMELYQDLKKLREE